jgi:hypothetical protein
VIKLLVAVSILAGMVAAARAAEETFSYLVVIDLTTGDGKPTLGQRSIALPDAAADEKTQPVVAKYRQQVDALRGSAVGTPLSLKDYKTAFKGVSALADTRTKMSAEDTIDVAVVFASDELEPTVELDEGVRRTQLATDFGTLLRIALALPSKGGGTAPTYRVKHTTFALSGGFVRSNLKFTCVTRKKTSVESAAYAACEEDAKVKDKSTCDVSFDPSMTADVTVVLTLVNGPTEHAFISADVPITKLSDVQFDSTGHSIGTTGTPVRPHAGFNFMVGDVLDTLRPHWYDGLMAKGLVLISRRPTDSYGIGAGYRFPSEWAPFGLQLDNLSVFAAWMRSRVASAATGSGATAAGLPSLRSKEGVRFGLSFNLDKALDWVKPPTTTQSAAKK